jgi:hypothetical protein
VIRLGQRAIAVGMPGEGKSALCADVFARYGGQRILIDVQDAYELGPASLAEGACEASSVSEIDWRFRTIRYVPRRLSQREYDDVYAAIEARGNLLVWLDEAYGPTTSASCPLFLRKVITQGRKRRITHLTTTQRPARIEPTLLALSEHAYVFRLVHPDDVDRVAQRVGADKRELAQLLAELPDHGYLYSAAGGRELVRMPPLPADRLEAARQHVRV